MREGCRAYLLAVGAAVCAFFMDGALKAMGVMMLDIQEDFSLQTWIIGSIASLMMSGIGCLFGKYNSKIKFIFIFIFIYFSLQYCVCFYHKENLERRLNPS